MGADEQCEVGRARGKEIGVGEEPALGARSRDADPLRKLRRRQVEHGLRDGRVRPERHSELGKRRALDEGEPDLRDIALRELVEELPQRGALCELVVSRLDRTIRTLEARQRDEQELRGQRPGGRELARDGLEARPRLHVEGEWRDRQRQRLADPPPQRAGADRNDDHEERRGAGNEEERSRHGAIESGPAERRTGSRGTQDYNRRMQIARSDASAAGGFTLIEVLVVIVILGILAALVVPRVLERPDEARAVAAKSDIAAILAGLKLYRLDNQRYPTAEQGLAALIARPTQPPAPPNWKPNGYLERLPKDPWGHPYQYLNPGLRGEIDVYSLGADGQPGGTGIDADIGSWDL